MIVLTKFMIKKCWDRCRMLSKKVISRRVVICVGILGVIFLMGAFSSLYQVGTASWVHAVLYKGKVLFGMTKIEGVEGGIEISSSRYDFVTVTKGSKTGVYQVATTDGKNVLAVERNTGFLVMLSPEKDGYIEKVLSESIFPKHISGEVLVNAAKGMANSNPPIIMDLHFGLNKLMYSLVEQKTDATTSQKCQALVLYEVPFVLPAQVMGDVIERFRTPCSADTTNAVMWAGRIVTNKKNIFLSVGEQRYDRSGFPKAGLFKESDMSVHKTVFGKILAFEPIKFTYTIYSTGHRNAQGLFWDNERSQLLSSEHGPNGGDEINVIVQGKHYGWPTVSYGKPYSERYPTGIKEIHGAKNPQTGVDLIPERKGYFSGTHNGFTAPLLSWIPGVGVGNVFRVSAESPLKDWQGDILAATMGEGSLHRLRLVNGAVVLDEDIKINQRIRDFIVLSNGHIVVGLDVGSLLVLKVAEL